MKYVIDRVELIELTYNEDLNNFNVKTVDDFLADKQPIEDVTGTIIIDDNNIDNVGYWFKGYKGKQIKIYIEVNNV